MERTLIIIKPDALVKRSVGEIMGRFEKEGGRIAAVKMVFLTLEKARMFYGEHLGKDFYEPLVKFMSSNPCFAMVLEGDDMIRKVREIVGNTDSAKAAKGTLRNLFGTDNRHNAVHASDSPEKAKREISFFFSEDEIFSWEDRIYKK